MTRNPIGLYVHVPFCAQRCAYCNFVLTTHASEDRKASYFNGLEKQFSETIRRFGPMRFDTLYFGGGTPSELNEAQVDVLFAALSPYCSRENIHDRAEITVEMNPADVTESLVQKWVSHGMNRVSLGAQSFNDELLRKTNRNHQVRDIVQSIQILKDAGIQNISLDLIIRLPGQTLEDVRYACQKSAELGASQVVIYDLEIHDQTAFGMLHKRKKLTLPDADEHLQMYESAQQILCRNHSYEQYELLSFARRESESKHNLKYWHNQEYLGLGPGAYSYLDGIRFQYCSSVERFQKKTNSDDFSNDSEDVLTASEIELETLLTGLRLKEGVEKKHFHRLHAVLEHRMKPLIESGFVEDRQQKYFLTPKGVRVAEDVFMELSDLAGS